MRVSGERGKPTPVEGRLWEHVQVNEPVEIKRCRRFSLSADMRAPLIRDPVEPLGTRPTLRCIFSEKRELGRNGICVTKLLDSMYPCLRADFLFVRQCLGGGVLFHEVCIVQLYAEYRYAVIYACKNGIVTRIHMTLFPL